MAWLPRPRRDVLILGLIALGSLLSGAPRNRLAPSLRWKEITRARVIVVFPEGYEIQAGEIAGIAERQYRDLANLWNVWLREKIRILLAPDSDMAGGSTLLFPYPTIRIDLAPPSPDSRLSGGRESWFEKILAHELTRILLLNKSSSFFRSLRRILGPIPATLPMMQYPPWLLEGLAVFSESLICPSGRLNTPDFHQMLLRITAEGGFRDFLDIKGSPSQWPGPATKFLYGAELFRFLGQRYGRESLQNLVDHLSRVPLSLSINHRFKRVYRRKLRKLWEEFGRAVAGSGITPVNMRPLTRDGWEKQYPETLGKSQLAWVFNNHRSRPGIRIMDQHTGRARWLLRRQGISSLAYDPARQRLFFSAPEVFQSFRWISDIYSCSPINGEHLRWSRGRSLFHPHPFPDGSGLVCVSRDRHRFYLVRLNGPMENPGEISEEFAGLAHPRVSPDGKRIAVAAKRRGTTWSIGIFSATGKLQHLIRIPEKRCGNPRWIGNNRVAFILSGHESTSIALADICSRRVQVTKGSDAPEIRYLAVRDNREILVVALNANGQDLAVLPIRELELVVIPSLWNPPRIRHQLKTVPRTYVYNSWRELVPRYISPDGSYLEKEIQVGARVSGKDVPGRYAYMARALYGTKTRHWNSDIRLSLNTFLPAITLSWRREHLVMENRVSGDFFRTNGYLNLEATFPLAVRRRYRWDLAVGFHVNRIQDRRFFHEEGETIELNGFSTRLTHRSAQRYYDAFTHTDGGRMTFMTSWDLALNGSSTVHSMALDLRRYISLGHPNVLALRLAAAHSWGDAPRVFYQGGSLAPTDAGLVEGGLFSLLRGFPAGYSAGFGGWQLNTEIRLQLLKIERAFPIGPSFERLYMSLFCDMGNMWSKHLYLEPIVTWGAELGLLLHMRGHLNLALGMAFSRSLPENPTIYFRIGESF